MFSNVSRMVSVGGTVVSLFAFAGAASAQWYPSGYACQCVRPVVQTYYRTVPVTEYRQVRQTVKRPVIETKYVERPVTEYRPITETRTVDVPTVSYQNVTEYRTVQQDRGSWITQYHPRPQCSPCEYDARPDLAGWFNRTSYSIRAAFTPRYTITRHYVPNVVAYVVPVTRRVAVRGTQKMTYNVTRLVPHQTTRKVAVNTVRYVDQEVIAMKPVTVMRTVPIGTRTAYSYVPFFGGGTRTALQPSPDPISGGRAPKRTAEKTKRFKRNPSSRDDTDTSERDDPAIRKSSMFVPPRERAPDTTYPQIRSADARSRAARHWQIIDVPSVVRVDRWTTTRSQHPEGPLLNPPAVSVAATRR